MRVLSIGARKRVLEKFSRALERKGYSAMWTHNHRDVQRVLETYPPIDVDVIAFGRGVDNLHKKQFKAEFSKQNPAIKYVEGLAPITDLLVDQIALTQSGKSVEHHLKIADRQIQISTNVPSRVTVVHYRLNFFYQSSKRILFNHAATHGMTFINYRKMSGRNFIVISINNLVTHIEEV